jgi:hypothetical protein
MPDTDTTAAPTDEDELRLVVERLSRSDRAGGRVIERAALMAEGPRSAALIAWLGDHGWEPEAPAAAAPRGGGLHGQREHRSASSGAPARYVLAPGAAGAR